MKHGPIRIFLHGCASNVLSHQTPNENKKIRQELCRVFDRAGFTVDTRSGVEYDILFRTRGRGWSLIGFCCSESHFGVRARPGLKNMVEVDLSCDVPDEKEDALDFLTGLLNSFFKAEASTIEYGAPRGSKGQRKVA